jgi:hypothetical protein
LNRQDTKKGREEEGELNRQDAKSAKLRGERRRREEEER